MNTNEGMAFKDMTEEIGYTRVDISHEGSGNNSLHHIDLDTTGCGQELYVNGIQMDKVRITLEGDLEFEDFVIGIRRNLNLKHA